MKVGDKVKVIDGSWMMTIRNGELYHLGASPQTRTIGWCKDSFTIVAIGSGFPIDDDCIGTRGFDSNTIMAVHDPTKEIWFGSSINFSVIRPKLTLDELYSIVGYKFELD